MQTMDIGSATVQTTRRGLMGLLTSENGKRWVMYGTVSAVAILTSWVTFVLAHNVIGRSLLESQVWSTIISTIPAFILSRQWVWAKDGKVSVSREVLPFWILSIVQFFITLIIVALLKGWIESTFADLKVRSIVVLTLNLGLYGAMWVGKFFFLNNLLFRNAQPVESR
jgi:putative flippase GtrA